MGHRPLAQAAFGAPPAGQRPEEHGFPDVPLCAEKLEIRRLTLFEPQCSQVGREPPERTKASNRPPQDLHSYS